MARGLSKDVKAKKRTQKDKQSDAAGNGALARDNGRRDGASRDEAGSPDGAGTVEKFASSQPEARDEGPRLLPLESAPSLHSRLLDLADIALGTRKADPLRVKRRPQGK